MQISMKDLDKLTLSEMEDLLAGSRKITWTSEDAEAKYNFISAVLRQRSYSKLGKRERGVVRQFLAKVAAISRAQMTRLIAQWMEHRTIRRKPPCRPNFVCRYRKEDVHLLAATDAAHEDLSGPALRRILHREYKVFSKPAYERLSQISVSHIYNLRRSAVYRQQRVRVQHTQSRQIPIGDRRKPDPKGKPGYLRVDTVHQGQHDGKAGVFHINAVDTVTQWQAIGCVETISERHMIPVLEAGSDPASVPVSHSGLPLRQRFGVYQSECGAPTGKAADRVHQEPCLPNHRQRTGGGQKRRYRAQAHRLRFYCFRSRRGAAAVLHSALQPLPQLPSALWICRAKARRARTDAARLCGRRLPHAVREVVDAASLAVVSQTRLNGGAAAPASVPAQRYRGCQADASGQTRLTQARTNVKHSINSFSLARVNTGLTGEGGSTASPFPLDPSPATELPTERTLFSAVIPMFCSGSLRIGMNLYFQAHLALEINSPFRLIYGLENAMPEVIIAGSALFAGAWHGFWRCFLAWARSFWYRRWWAGVQLIISSSKRGLAASA